MSDFKHNLIYLIGFIFLIFGILAIVNTIAHIDEGLAPILWFSYIGLIVLAIGCFRHDSSLIASQLCILAIPYLFWNIDFFTYLFTGNSLWGIVDYFFNEGDLLGKLISLQHIFNVPLSLFAIYIIKLKRNDFWKISFFEIFVLFFASRWFTTPMQNVNCVYHNCANFDFEIWYPFQWFLGYFVMISITSIILIKIFRRNSSEKH